MNIVDLVIALLLIAAIFRGMRFGLARLLLSSAGFLLGLFIGFWVAKYGSVYIDSPTGKTLYIIGIELLFALALSSVGEVLGIRLSSSAHKFRLNQINHVLGSIFEVAFVLFAVWLVASGLSNIQSYDIGRSIHGSAIIKKLNNSLPNPPDFFAQLEKLIDPNGFPKVFLGSEPEHTTIAANPEVDNEVVAKAEKSVVRIEGRGCGGIIEGSGFVVDKGLVVTNAHVVAGVPKPTVVNQTGVFKASPIWFDPDLDIAILNVANLPDPGIPLASNAHLTPGASAVVLGFPGGGPMTANKAVVIDQVRAVGRNIYNRGVVTRNIYELQTNIKSGNSGGPVIESDGEVAAIVFAKGVSQANVGYALVIDEAKPLIEQAKSQRTPVSVGSCAAS